MKKKPKLNEVFGANAIDAKSADLEELRGDLEEHGYALNSARKHGDSSKIERIAKEVESNISDIFPEAVASFPVQPWSNEFEFQVRSGTLEAEHVQGNAGYEYDPVTKQWKED